MSRSRRITAIIGLTTAPNDKPFKVDEHRAERHAVRAVVKRSLDGDDRALHSKVYGDPWKSPKDGKQMVDPRSNVILSKCRKGSNRPIAEGVSST